LLVESLVAHFSMSHVNQTGDRASNPEGRSGGKTMGERWRGSDPEGWRNGVDYRIRSEEIEREWLTGLFSSVGQERADARALLARLRERRTIGFRRASLHLTRQKGARG
jgi:hypothetical protein